MAKIFNWFDNWKTENLDCPGCGWHGLIDNDHTEDFDQLLDFHCPKCGKMLAIINFPTPEEVREHSDEISAEDMEFYDKQLDHADEFEEHHLESADQLPDIEADPLILVWDMEFNSGGEFAGPSYVVIKHDGKEIWRERAYFECVDRFNEVVEVLRQKYGERLKALIPAGRSTTYLYGDIISPSRMVLNIPESYPGLGLTALAQAGDQQALNWLRYRREFAAHHLERADQLPDVSGDSLVLSWDLAEDPPRVKLHVGNGGSYYDWDRTESDGFLYVTLSHEGRELWREAAITNSAFVGEGEFRPEMAERYGQIVEIAKIKYGAKLMDVVPTLRSDAYYGGLYDWDAITEIRSKNFPESEDKVLNILKKAAAGYIEEQCDAADMFLLAKGVPTDAVRAAYWCRQAADQGSAYAQCGLGILYENGDGVPQDDVESNKWYRLAADQGDEFALDKIRSGVSTSVGAAPDPPVPDGSPKSR